MRKNTRRSMITSSPTRKTGKRMKKTRRVYWC